MGFFNKLFPETDFHKLNADWILEKVKQSAEAATQAAEEAAESAATVSTYEERLHAVEVTCAAVPGIAESVSNLIQSVTSLQNSVNFLITASGQISTRVNGIEERLQAVEVTCSAVPGIAESVSGLIQSVSSLQNSVSFLITASGQISTRVNGVENRVDSAESDLYGIIGVGDYVEKAWGTYGTLQAGRSAGAYPLQNLISEAYNASYDSYYIVVSHDTKFYVNATNIPYYALCIGENATGEWYEGENNTLLHACNSAYRVRKSENNLPTANNPIIVPSGGIIVATVTAGASPSIFVFEEVEEEKQVKIGKIYCKKDSGSVTIAGKNYTVKFEKISTNQGYQWNITSLKGQGNNMIPVGVDMIGVIQFVGASNFMGGAHGNESNYEFRVMASGADLPAEGYYDEIHIIMNSHLYDPDNTSDNVVDRFVEFVFNSDGWKCRNTFKILTTAQVQVAYPSGLFAFTATDCNGAYSNVGTVNLSSTASRQLESDEFKEITINLTDNLTVNLSSETGERGWVTYRSNTQSFKVYFANAELQNVSNGDIISGCCKYKF